MENLKNRLEYLANNGGTLEDVINETQTYLNNNNLGNLVLDNSTTIAVLEKFYDQNIPTKLMDILMSKERKEQRIAELSYELDELRKDFAQHIAGIFVPDIEQKKTLYRKDYVELCELKNVKPKDILIK